MDKEWPEAPHGQDCALCTDPCEAEFLVRHLTANGSHPGICQKQLLALKKWVRCLGVQYLQIQEQTMHQGRIHNHCMWCLQQGASHHWKHCVHGAPLICRTCIKMIQEAHEQTDAQVLEVPCFVCKTTSAFRQFRKPGPSFEKGQPGKNQFNSEKPLKK